MRKLLRLLFVILVALIYTLSMLWLLSLIVSFCVELYEGSDDYKTALNFSLRPYTKVYYVYKGK